MKYILLVLSMVGLNLSSGHQHLCEGFVPENDLYIPVNLKVKSGIEEQTFHDVLDRVERVYTPQIRDLGGSFVLRRYWSSGVVNASAQRQGRSYIVNMYGGLARHETITQEGFALVACHEVGHHLAGAPKINNWFSTWASNEGQSDYFASLRCFREIFTEQENLEFVENNEIDPYLFEACSQVHEGYESEIHLCIRSGMAALSVGYFFQTLRGEEVVPHFSTPDAKQVDSTFMSHPQTQCRLDTVFQGALCVHDYDQPLSDSDPRAGTCHDYTEGAIGYRPRCWYKP